MQTESKKKRDNFHQQIVSQQKRKIFEEAREKLIQARLDEQHLQADILENEMMRMFQSKEQYEETMKLYEEFARSQESEQRRFEEMEDSMNFDNKIWLNEVEKKKKVCYEMFQNQEYQM